MRRPAFTGPSGFTLLEMMITVSLFVLVVGSVFGMLGVSQGALVDQSAQADLENTGRRVLNRIADDFRGGVLNSLNPAAPSSSKSLSVSPAADYTNGAVTLGAAVTYQWVADPADPPNGLDDDGDGFIDEGSVVRTVGGVSTTIASNVSNLTFTLAGNTLFCTVTLQRTVRGRRTFTFTDTLDLRFRN